MVILDDIELRVLGVLIEKSLTQPDAYPLTFNSVQLGANQKQNREPVREFSQRDISEALRTLELKKLVSQAPPAIGARSVRFRHHVVEQFHWDRREQAIMAELLLRGRQTAGELRTHASRMTPFADLEAVAVTLNALRSHEHFFVEELAREPGRSANRFRHLLGANQASPMPVAESNQSANHPKEHLVAEASNQMSLVQRVEVLERTVARLAAEIALNKGKEPAAIDADQAERI